MPVQQKMVAAIGMTKEEHEVLLYLLEAATFADMTPRKGGAAERLLARCNQATKAVCISRDLLGALIEAGDRGASDLSSCAEDSKEPEEEEWADKAWTAVEGARAVLHEGARR